MRQRNFSSVTNSNYSNWLSFSVPCILDEDFDMHHKFVTGLLWAYGTARYSFMLRYSQIIRVLMNRVGKVFFTRRGRAVFPTHPVSEVLDREVPLPSRLFQTPLLFISSLMLMLLSSHGIFITLPFAIGTSIELLVYLEKKYILTIFQSLDCIIDEKEIFFSWAPSNVPKPGRRGVVKGGGRQPYQGNLRWSQAGSE